MLPTLTPFHFALARAAQTVLASGISDRLVRQDTLWDIARLEEPSAHRYFTARFLDRESGGSAELHVGLRDSRLIAQLTWPAQTLPVSSITAAQRLHFITLVAELVSDVDLVLHDLGPVAEPEGSVLDPSERVTIPG